jgi:hypothetical protein
VPKSLHGLNLRICFSLSETGAFAPHFEVKRQETALPLRKQKFWSDNFMSSIADYFRKLAPLVNIDFRPVKGSFQGGSPFVPLLLTA